MKYHEGNEVWPRYIVAGEIRKRIRKALRKKKEVNILQSFYL